MTIDEALKELAGAKAHKLPWKRIAEILQAARSGQASGRLSGAFIDDASRASGYAPALLRRFEAAHQFLSKLDRDHPELRASERLGSATATMFQVEQLKRLYGIDRQKALALYDQVAEGKLSVRALEREYKTALGAPGLTQADPFGSQQRFNTVSAGSKPVRKLFASPFHAVCWEALQAEISKLSGEGDIRQSCDYKFTYFTPFSVAVGMREFGIDFIDGFYPILLEAGHSRAQLNRALKDIAFQAPFFRRFWVLVPPGGGGATICEELAAIGLDEVGCAELRDGHFNIKKNGTGMRAVQQQAKLAAGVLEAGIPKR